MRLAWIVLPGLAACAGPALDVTTWDLRPAPSPAPSEAVSLSVRVEPFAGVAGRDAYEVLARTGARELVRDDSRRWSRRPPAAAGATVVDALRATGAFDRVDVAGAAAGRGAELLLSGEVLTFEEQDGGAEVSLAATLAPVEGRLVPAAPSRIEGAGRAPFAGDDPAARAAAMEEALAAAASSLAEEVAAAAAEYRRAPAREVAEEAAADPARLDLVVPPADVGDVPPRDVRVGRLDAPAVLDRLDVLERRAPHRVAARPDLVWTRRPSEVVADALADTLRRAIGEDGRVLRDGGARRGEVEVAGRLRRFELDATGARPAALVEVEVTVDGRSERRLARTEVGGDGPDAVARAFAAAVAEVVADVPARVGAAARPAEPASPPPAPAERFLAVEPPMPPAGAPASDVSLGVARLAGPGGVDRLELAHRDARRVVSLDPELRWERRPALVVTDGLIRALDASGAFPAGVVGPGAAAEPELRLTGSVERFDFERREGRRAAVVSLRLELRRGGAVVRFGASGSADVEDDEPHALADAMGRALGAALTDAVAAVAAASRELTD